MPIGDNQRFVPASGKDGISPGLNIRDLIHSLNEYQDGRHGRGHPAGGHPPERPLHYPGICRRQLRRSDKRARVGAVTLNDQSRPTTQRKPGRPGAVCLNKCDHINENPGSSSQKAGASVEV